MKKSQELYEQACQILPGGVNSPVRSCKNIGITPLFIKSAHGAIITDEDGNDMIDYVGSWGPMIHGHCHPDILQAVKQAADLGLSYGAPTEAETVLAQLIQDFMPSLEQIRLVNSGTEATMTAIRLARGYTHRDKIIKFSGCYHGHSDCLLVEAGSGALTHGHPSSPGVPKATAQDTLVANFNDIESVTQLLEQHPQEVAAIIIEPIAGNMNLVKPQEGFLQALREACDQHGTLLILDEVMTGFRVAAGGAQSLYHIQPDLTTLGKIIGGGMPLAAFGGRKEIMQSLAPQGPVYQAGTLSGNPIATAAGIAALTLLKQPNFYQDINAKTATLVDGINQIAQKHSVTLHADHMGAMFGIYFTKDPVTDYASALKTDKAMFNRFYQAMLSQGIYLAPSPFEAGFVSAAHTSAILDKTLSAFDVVLAG